MNNVKKAIMLDFLLGKQCIKYLIYFLLIAIFLVMSSKNLTSGIVTVMTLIPIKGVSFAFQCEEKSDINRLHGFLPIKKSQLVIGRYLYMTIIGFVVLIISLIAQSIILTYMGIHLELIDCIRAFLLGISVYLLSISLQLPSFYKLGSIRGSLFAYTPLIFFLILFYIIGGFKNCGVQTIPFFINNLTLISIIFIISSVILLIISIIISLSIYKEKI